jgi:hypothetical protein
LAIFVLTYSPLRKEKWRMEGIGLVYPQCWWYILLDILWRWKMRSFLCLAAF